MVESEGNMQRKRMVSRNEWVKGNRGGGWGGEWG